MDLQAKILQQIEAKIVTKQLDLPSLPDIFIQVKQIVDDPNSTIIKISEAITSDPELTARILKISNNALYRSTHKITKLQHAISRLGLNLTKTLVTSHAITRLFNPPEGKLNAFFCELQQRSTDVSAHAYALAKNFSSINPDDALLAGLVHNIGYLPIARCTDLFTEAENDPAFLIEAMGNVHTRVSEMVLKSWSFPEHIIQASVHYVDQFRAGTDMLDLTDIVIIAGLNTYRGTGHPCTLPDWSRYPAFQKIGIHTREDLVQLDRINADIENARHMLGLTSGIE